MSEYQQVVDEGARSLGQKARRGLLILLGLAVLGLGIYVWVSNWTYSRGTRAGYLIKVSKKGWIWKTYEGQLNLGGVTTDPQSGLAGNIWEFSIPKADVYQAFQNAEGQRVKVYYRQVYNNLPWQGKTDYFVYDVDVIPEPGRQ